MKPLPDMDRVEYTFWMNVRYFADVLGFLVVFCPLMLIESIVGKFRKPKTLKA